MRCAAEAFMYWFGFEEGVGIAAAAFKTHFHTHFNAHDARSLEVGEFTRG